MKKITLIMAVAFACFQTAATAQCVSTIHVTNPINNGITVIKQATDSVTANNKVNIGATTLYRAEGRVVLKHEFHAKKGCRFHAKIEPCDPTISVNEFAKAINTVNVYPNPFANSLAFEFTTEDDLPVALNIYDITGKDVAIWNKQQNYTDGTHRIELNTAHLAPGLYTYLLTQSSTTSSGKIILQR